MGKQSLSQQSLALLIVGAVLVAAFAATPIYAQVPVIPQAFYGTVVINGEPAPVGTTIEARGTNVKTGLQGNPLTTIEVGKYGGRSISDLKLAVQGNLTGGTAIEFYINGVKADCAVPGGPWQSSFPFQSEAVTELNLSVGQSATPTATQQSMPTLTATPTSTPPPPSTPTATPTAGATRRQDSLVPTATRQTPQAAGGGNTPQPTAGSDTPSPVPPTPVAQPTSLQKALITQPTQLAGQSAAPMQSPTPVVPGETAQPMPASPTATQVALPTASLASATPAAIAKASASTPRPTSKPIIPGDAQASTQSSPDQSAPAPGASSFGGLLAPLGGIVVLVIAVVVGGLIVLRRRSG
jgi:hypothetical protein